MLVSFLSGEFLLHIPCWLHFYLGSFSYTSPAGFIFIWGVSLTHPMLVSFLSGEFLLHTPCWFHFHRGSFSYTSRAVLILMKEFLFHIPYSFLFFFFFVFPFFFFFFYLGSFSYTSLAGFIFIWGGSLTHPMPASILSGEFLLHIPCWLYFYLGSFS